MSVSAGRIELIVGPMFAGKTTEMLRRLDRAELARHKCCVMKYDKDNRYSSDNVSTHDFKMRKAIPCAALMPHLEQCYDYDVIGVDEGQFFPDVVEFAEKLANNGKVVIVAGLDGTFQRKPFGQMLNLISKCESLTKLTAVCTETGGDACYTQRTVKSDEIELIGGGEMYRAASRASFFNKEISGEIHLTLGPVSSGKTTELLRILNRHRIAGKSPLLIYNSGNKNIKSVKYDSLVCNELPKIDEIDKYHIIGIDEAQRYQNIAEWADELANRGKLVIVSALDSDENQNPYSSIIDLFPLCEKVQLLDSICPITGLPAPFNAVVGMNLIPISRFALLQSAILNAPLTVGE